MRLLRLRDKCGQAVAINPQHIRAVDRFQPGTVLMSMLWLENRQLLVDMPPEELCQEIDAALNQSAQEEQGVHLTTDTTEERAHRA